MNTPLARGVCATRQASCQLEQNGYSRCFFNCALIFFASQA
jgi:hypothetical protein